jgi:hypothetical protein
MTKKAHLFPMVLTFAVVAAILALTQIQIRYTALEVTIIVSIYFLVNIIYSIHQKTFSLKRLVEIGLIAVIAQFIALAYII